MKKITLALLIVTALTASLWTASAQQQTPAPTQKSTQQLSPEEVIKRFTAKESELREVWKDYQYQQETKFQVLGAANTVRGEFYQLSEFVFNDAGKRLERILRAPVSTLDQTGLSMSPEDRNGLVNLQPFSLTAEDLPIYSVSYFGKEKIDDLNTYVFDVTPKVMSNPRELDKLKKQKIEGKFFQGRIWVDDEDLQVVKTAGRLVPEFKQRFPKFETYRENIEGRYWFPTYTYGDDKLFFEEGPPYHVRMVIKYKNYRRFQSDIKFIDGAEVVDDPKSGEVKPGEAKKEEPKKEDPKAKPTPTPRPRPRP